MSYLDLDPTKIESELKRKFISALNLILKDTCALTEREREILLMRFVMNMTFKEIGEQMGLTRERVRQIVEKRINTMDVNQRLVNTSEILLQELQKENEELNSRLKRIGDILKEEGNINDELEKILFRPDEFHRSNAINKIKISNLDLSARTKNALINSGIYTIEDLLNFDKKQIKMLQNIGPKTGHEIFDLLKKLRLTPKS